MKLTTSVIICTRNRPDDVLKCLTSLQFQTVAPTELIIVDSSDTLLTQYESFKSIFSQNNFCNTRLSYIYTTPGLTRQRNEGIRHATGDIIYFFDDDVVLEPNYIEQMQHIFENYPQYGGGMGDITNITKANWRYRLFRTIFLLPREGASGKFTWSGMPTHPYGTRDFKNVEVLGGCCMVFRANILRQYMFDENLTGYAYMEDCDISRRISYDYPLFFNPKARLQHFASPIARDRIVDNSAMFVRNYRYLVNKNNKRSRVLISLFQAWSLGGLLFEALLLHKYAHLRGYLRSLKIRIEML